MSDNPEVSYYQSVVDDMRVSLERNRELLEDLKEETIMLRRIVAAVHLFLGSLDEESVLDEGDCLLEVSRQVSNYQTSRKAVL